MKFSGMSPGDIVAHVYSAFEPAPMWDADRLRGMNTQSLPRLYCPNCRRHGNIMRGDMYAPAKRNPDNASKPAKEHAHWYCSACKTWNRRPLVLRQRGEIGGTQTRSQKDNDWMIVDGIEAGKVMSAVESLPPAPRCWALWTHTHTGTASMQNQLVELALIELDKRGMGRPGSYREGRSVLMLAIMISEDSRERARNGRSLYSYERLADAVRINRSEMSQGRRWGKLREGLIGVFAELETEMARAVIGAIRTPITESA